MNSDATESLQLELERAQALVGLGRFDQASLQLQELLAREPNLAPAWCLLAQAQIGVGEMEAALDAAEHAAALAPEDDWPHRLRSVALLQLGDEDGAIAAAREAVAAGPHNWQAHNRLAISLGAAKRDLDDALAAGERAVALAPNQPDAHFALGLVYETRRKRKLADESFKRALALDPQHGPSQSALARRQLAGSRFGRAGKLADAAAGFRDVVQADPRADYAAKNLELVLRVFLARLSYLVFVIAYISSAITAATLGARIAPLLLLAVPAAFAFRFLSRLEPDLRRHVRYIAFHGKLAAPSIAQCCAIGLLFVSAVAPSDARQGLNIAAAIVSFAARLLLARGLGGRLLSATPRGIVVAAVVLTILFLVGTTLGGGFDPARGIVFVLLASILGLAAYWIRQHRRA